jgi:hypothetical protein
MKPYPIILPALLIASAQSMFAAVPKLSAASLTVSRGEPWLLYGTRLDAPQTTVFVAGGAIFLPDQKTQAFYRLQLHKLGSAVRRDGPMMDLMGPWWGSSPWPAIWWNLNVQLAYQPCAPANRPELRDSLVTMIETNADRMGQCVPAKWGGPKAMAVGRVSSYDGLSLARALSDSLNCTLQAALIAGARLVMTLAGPAGLGPGDLPRSAGSPLSNLKRQSPENEQQINCTNNLGVKTKP